MVIILYLDLKKPTDRPFRGAKGASEYGIGERVYYTQNSLTMVLPVVAGCFLFFTTGFFATADVETVEATEACGKFLK